MIERCRYLNCRARRNESPVEILDWPPMNNIAEMEARELLARPSICEFEGDWLQEKVSPGTVTIAAGLMDCEGVGRRMMVRLLFHRSPKTGLIKYKFSVFNRTRYSLDRVYELEVTHSPKPIKNLHAISHEHIGALRRNGNEAWSKWGFEDVLEYFCAATNIEMSPKPQDPEHFELRS